MFNSKPHCNKIKGNSIKFIFAVISGLPIPCKKANGIYAMPLKKTPAANSCKIRELFSANFFPNHSPIPSLAKVIIVRTIGNKKIKIYLTALIDNFLVCSGLFK